MQRVEYSSIISKWLGTVYCVQSKVVPVKTRNYDDFNRRLCRHRPTYRLSKEIYCRYGILYPDVAFLPKSLIDTQNLNDTFSVEIKPKQGWTFNSWAAAVDKCRYCLSQYLKVIKLCNFA